MPDTPPSTDPIRSDAPPAARPGSYGARIRAYTLLWAIAIVTLVADQLTKAWIIDRMPLGTDSRSREAITAIPGFAYIIHQGNTGAAWSMFSGQSVALACLAAITLLAIFFSRRALGLRLLAIQIPFGLLCGGIAGNLLDRLRHGYVVDFIDLHFGHYIFPTFNVADSGICVGVILYLWHSLRTPDAPRAE